MHDHWYTAWWLLPIWFLVVWVLLGLALRLVTPRSRR